MATSRRYASSAKVTTNNNGMPSSVLEMADLEHGRYIDSVVAFGEARSVKISLVDDCSAGMHKITNETYVYLYSPTGLFMLQYKIYGG